MELPRILYIRSAPYVLSFDSYNLQEVGLGKAFCKLGYDFDLIYYSKESRDQVIKVESKKLTILWRKGIRILRTGIYPFALKRDFLARYDAVIVSEYDQIMSYLIARRHPNTFLYNGLYYNLFKIPFLEPIYSFLFNKRENSRLKHIFCKTVDANDYLESRRFSRSSVVGVGLDPEKYESERAPEPVTLDLVAKMENRRNLLYVGSVSSRKNVDFLIRVFNELKKSSANADLQLVIVGKSEYGFWERCRKIIAPQTEKFVVYVPFIKNAQLKFVYTKADAFVLPSKREIFGMVLLEAMYFGVPVVASASAGAKTLIENETSGIIVGDFDVESWKNAIEKVLLPESRFLGANAENRIKTLFLWDRIAKSMMVKMRKS